VHGDNEHDNKELPTTSGSSPPTLDVGTKVCVRNRFLGDWTSGFEVAEVHHSGYRIRRLLDGHAFPDVFPFEDVRLERRQHPLRGIGESWLDRRQV